jgi:hypothetical protein
MATTRISSDQPDLSPVFGKQDEDAAAMLAEILAGADSAVTETVGKLNEQAADAGFDTDGVVLETEVSGQAMVRVQVENAKRSVTFAAELRPHNFYGDEENPWQPGRPPLVMATDGWNVDAAVSVRYKTRVQSRPYTIQEQIEELEEERFETPEAAARGFAAVCERLAELALSREPTVAGWKPEIPEEVGGPPIQY